MSASFRKISRLSLEIFQDLITRPPSNPTTTEASSNRRRPTATSHNDTVESDRDAHDNYSTDPSRLRQVICHRLQRVPIRYVTGGRRRYGRPARHQSLGSGNHNNNDNRDRDRDNRDFTTFTKVETVGELLMLSRYTLLLVLDPILTYEEIGILLSRISFQCTPKPVNVLRLIRGQQQQQQQQRMLINNPRTHGASDGTDFTTTTGPTAKRITHRQIHPSYVLPTGLESLDRLLRGGIRVRSVTELVGRSGVGKTQLAFQLSVMAAKLNYSTVYIDTEKKISVHRLKEMASYRYNDSMSRISENDMASLLGTGNVPFSYGCQTHRGTLSLSAISQQEFLQSAAATPTSPMNPSQGIGNNGNGNMFKNADDVVKNMIFRRPHSTNDLLQTLMSLESEIVHWNDDIVMDQNQTSHNQPPNKSSSSPTTTTTARKQFPVRLIVVDSIAATMRRDFGADAFPQRASAIFQCAQILKRLADQLNLAIFVINQVGAGNNSISDIQGGWNSGTGSSSSIINADPRAVKAALGTSWHHCVSTRLFMEEITNQQVQQQQQQTTDDDDYHHADGEDHGDRSHVGMMGKYSQRRSRRRKVVIVKSNLVPLAETYYEISTAGIVDV